MFSPIFGFKAFLDTRSTFKPKIPKPIILPETTFGRKHKRKTRDVIPLDVGYRYRKWDVPEMEDLLPDFRRVMQNFKGF